MQTLYTDILTAKLENLEKIQRAIADCARSQGLEPLAISRIELALEEAWVNICDHAYVQKNGEVEIHCRSDRKRLMIELIDSGIAYDITARPDPELAADVAQRKVGGLGVYFIKKTMDAVHYRRANDRNILTLTVNLKKEHE